MNKSRPDESNELQSSLARLATVFENSIALAQEGEAYLSEVRALLVKTRGETRMVPRRYTLLIVDDDGPLLRSLDRSLSETFLVTTASSVEHALMNMDSQRFDAVLSDFHLPDGNGLRVLTAFAQWNADGARVLFTGGASDAKIVQRAIKSKLVHRLVEKPVTSDLLKNVLLDLLIPKEKST